MRLLLVNPNTTGAVTELMAARAREIVGEAADIRAVTGRFGARYIASRAAAAIAAHAAMDAVAEHEEGCDAVLLACFGDPGLLALKESSPIPVVGMAEASCHLACLLGSRFSIVTGGERWGPMLREFVREIGLSSRLASVRTIAATGGEIAVGPDQALEALAAACQACSERDGADVVILGGAGLAGLAGRIRPKLTVPVVCSLEAGLQATLAIAGLGAADGAARPGRVPPPVETVGLAPALAEALAGKDIRGGERV
jgi:Asp/Glu/hydantoin racemase